MAAAAAAASHATLVASQGTWPGTARTDAAGRRTTAEADSQQRTAVAAGGKRSCLRGSMTDDDALTWPTLFYCLATQQLRCRLSLVLVTATFWLRQFILYSRDMLLSIAAKGRCLQ